MIKSNQLLQLKQNKQVFNIIYNFCIVTFLYIITVHHMYDSNYTFLRMTRFWTYFGVWSCQLYFFMNLLISIYKFHHIKSNNQENKENERKYKNGIKQIKNISEYLQQSAISIGLSVTTMFWFLYFKSPSNVFRETDEWEPNWFEELYCTHFEHSFPILFLIIDCLIFKQGNKNCKETKKISFKSTYCYCCLYCSFTLYDYFRFNIKPYPFMDDWNFYKVMGFVFCFFNLMIWIFNPLSWYIRYFLYKLTSHF